jgi:hypothetical protein
MADQIKFRIVIEGGPEVRSQIQKVFDDIKRVSKGKIDLGIDNKALGGIQQITQKIAAGWTAMAAPITQAHAAITRVHEATGNIGVALNNTTRHVRNLALSFGLVTGAVSALMRSALGLSNILQQQSAAAGLSVEEFSKFRYALGQNEGPLETAAIMMSYFNKKVAQAADGVGKGAELFKELGISVRDASGDIKPVMALLEETSQRMRELYLNGGNAITVTKTLGEDAKGASLGFERLHTSISTSEYAAKSAGAVARQLSTDFSKTGNMARFVQKNMDLFGRRGGAMGKFMALSKEQLHQVYEEAVKVGIVLSTEASESLDTFRDRLETTGQMLQNFVNRGLASITPAFAKYTDQVINYLSANRAAIDEYITGVMQNILHTIPAIAIAMRDIGLTLYNIGGYIATAVRTLTPLLDIFNKITGLKLSGWSAVTVAAVLYVTKALAVLKAILLAVAANLRFLLMTPIGRLVVLGATIMGMIKAMSGGWGTFKTAVSEAVKGAIDSLAGFWSNLVKEFPALQGLDDAVKTVFSSIKDNVDLALEGVKAAFLKTHEAITSLVTKFNELTGLNLNASMVELGAAILLLLNPIGLVRMAIGGLKLAMVSFVGLIGTWPAMIVVAIGAAWAAFTAFPDIGASIAQFFADAEASISVNAPKILEAIRATLAGIGPLLLEVTTMVVKAIIAMAKEGIEALGKEGSISAIGAIAQISAAILEMMGILAALLMIAIGEAIISGMETLAKLVLILLYKFFAELVPLVVESLAFFAFTLLAGIGEGILQGLEWLWNQFVDELDRLLKICGTSMADVKLVFHNAWDAIVSGLTWVWDKFKSFGNWIKSFFVTVDAAADKLENAASKASDAQQSISNANENQDNPGFTQGGRISGPGTGTSDSIPIWASNGEFMVRARAVSKYGVGLLHQINALRFADGGLIGASVLAPSIKLPTAGANTPHQVSRTLNLYLDGQRFEGLTAPDSVANDLEKFAAKKRMSSAGKRPKWVGA